MSRCEIPWIVRRLLHIGILFHHLIECDFAAPTHIWRAFWSSLSFTICQSNQTLRSYVIKQLILFLGITYRRGTKFTSCLAKRSQFDLLAYFKKTILGFRISSIYFFIWLKWAHRHSIWKADWWEAGFSQILDILVHNQTKLYGLNLVTKPFVSKGFFGCGSIFCLSL